MDQIFRFQADSPFHETHYETGTKPQTCSISDQTFPKSRSTYTSPNRPPAPAGYSTFFMHLRLLFFLNESELFNFDPDFGASPSFSTARGCCVADSPYPGRSCRSSDSWKTASGREETATPHRLNSATFFSAMSPGSGWQDGGWRGKRCARLRCSHVTRKPTPL